MRNPTSPREYVHKVRLRGTSIEGHVNDCSHDFYLVFVRSTSSLATKSCFQEQLPKNALTRMRHGGLLIEGPRELRANRPRHS